MNQTSAWSLGPPSLGVEVLQPVATSATSSHQPSLRFTIPLGPPNAFVVKMDTGADPLKVSTQPTPAWQQDRG
jgi:hypothetical protein